MTYPPFSERPENAEQPEEAERPPQYAPPVPPQYAPPLAPQYAAPEAGPYAPAQYGPAGGLPDPGPGEPFDGASDPADLGRPLYGATFGQAVKRFFTGYVRFTGRASRSEFWWAALFTLLVGLGPGILMVIAYVGIASEAIAGAEDPPLGMIVLLLVAYGVAMLFSLALLLPTIAVTWRRLHDANLAGPLYFLSFVPFAGGIALIVLACLPSKPEGRRFDLPAGRIPTGSSPTGY